LALYGTFARLLAAPDDDIGVAPSLAASFYGAVRDRWGSGRALRFFIQQIPHSDELARTIARYERSACTPQMAADILRLNTEIDIRSLLPTVQVPTLVLHSSGDRLIPVAIAQYMAAHLPDARFVEEAGDFHVCWDPTKLWFLDHVEDFFLGDRPRRPPTQRVLATVLFTDIVGSTEQAAAMGDRIWRQVLDRHDSACARAVGRFGGRLVKSTGDGLLATFDSPSSGVECARSIRSLLSDVGIRVRAGVHTGEVELRRGDVGGIAVHIGARIAALAHPDEIWVSRTVKDLTTGSGLLLAGRGRHALKGVPDQWELFSLS